MSEKPIKADLMAHMKRLFEAGALFLVPNELGFVMQDTTQRPMLMPEMKVKSVRDDAIDLYMSSPDMQQWVPGLISTQILHDQSALTEVHEMLLKRHTDPAIEHMMEMFQRIMEISIIFGHQPCRPMPWQDVILDDLTLLLLEKIDELDWQLDSMRPRHMVSIMLSRNSSPNFTRLSDERRRLQRELVDAVMYLVCHPHEHPSGDPAMHIKLSREVLLHTIFIPLWRGAELRPGERKLADLVFEAYLNARYTLEQIKERNASSPSLRLPTHIDLPVFGPIRP